MVLLLVVYIIKYIFDVPVVVMVSHIPVKSRIPVSGFRDHWLLLRLK